MQSKNFDRSSLIVQTCLNSIHKKLDGEGTIQNTANLERVACVFKSEDPQGKQILRFRNRKCL